MSGIINIAGLTPVDDPSYRYKMPRIQGKVEGRGNGIKTVLVNVTDVAASLNREAPEITKFFGCELGSQTTYAADSDRAIVNGAHTERDLQNHLSRYIENFVLCKGCRLPETYYKIKGGIISQKCNACGSKHSVDMTHKLTTFILAQHKKQKESGSKDKKDKEKKSKKPDEEGEKKSKKEKSRGSENVDEQANVAGAGAEEVEEEPIGNGEEESESVAIAESIERFKTWLGDNASAAPASIMEELRVLQTFGSFRASDRVIIYLGAAFSEHVVQNAEIAAHKAVLSLWAGSVPLQRHLIAGFEWFCSVRHPSILKLFPVVLKTLFDEELVEEDTFFAWHTDTIRNEFSADVSLVPTDNLEQLRSCALPFINWLQQAEVEGEDDEDDEDDGEEAEEDTGGEEDINIDDI